MSKHRGGGIIEEVLAPLLRQLATAKRLLHASSTKKSQTHVLFEKIRGELENMKSVFHSTREKEGEVADSFEVVAQLVDNMVVAIRLQGASSSHPLPGSVSAQESNYQNNKEFSASSSRSNLQTTKEEITPATVVSSNQGEALDFQSKLEVIEGKITDIRQTLEELLPFTERGRLFSHQQPSSPPPLTASESRATSGSVQEFSWKRNFEKSPAVSHLLVTIKLLEDQPMQLLSYLSIFPANEVVKKRLLIHWWIGEGIFSPSSGRSVEENVDMCVRELISRGLIEPVYRKCSSVVDGCKIYPWIQRLLISFPMREKLFSTPLRAYLTDTVRAKDLKGSNWDGITLYNINNKYLDFDNTWFEGKKELQVMQLGRWQDSAKHHVEIEDVKFLQGLKWMTNLKYLSLRGISRIIVLPDSIGNLTNLIILDLRACHNLERLTAAVTSLKRLRHLDVSECYLLEYMPKGLGSLSQLQVLKGFVIGNSRSKDPCSLAELAKLKKLQKLSIIIGRESLVWMGDFDSLQNFNELRSLTIRWGVVGSLTSISSSNTQERKKINRKGSLALQRLATLGSSKRFRVPTDNISLSPPPNLEKLDLRCFPRNTFQEWMSPTKLGNLKRLYIRGGKLESLGAETDWKVEVLRLKFLKNLERIENKLKDAFPHLSCLEICECTNLEGGIWEGDELNVKLASF